MSFGVPHFRLQHSPPLEDGVLTLTLASAACGEASSLNALAEPRPDPRLHQNYLFAYLGGAFACLADAVITLSTYHYIRKANRDLPSSARLPALERLLVTTAETNALTLAVVAATLAVLAGTRGYWVVAVSEGVPGVYVASLLVTLLSREGGGEAAARPAAELAEVSEEVREARAREQAQDAAWVPYKAAPGNNSAHTLVNMLAIGARPGGGSADKGNASGSSSGGATAVAVAVPAVAYTVNRTSVAQPHRGLP